MHDSLNKGILEDGKRSIAEKILKRLKELEKLVQHNQGRWAWELLQNARDSIIGTNRKYVSVQVELNESEIIFKHNGAPFTEKDLRGLINQISSKEVEVDVITEKTGRFGTGFLTTHLLSKTVNITGILHQGNNYKKFTFPLNRESKTINELIQKIDTSWGAVKNSLTPTTFDPSRYSTSFEYALKTTQQKEIAKIGIKEFTKLIPYVLVFVPLIKRVEIIHNGKSITFESNGRKKLLYEINKIVDGKTEKINILHCSDNKVTIAVEVKKRAKGYSVLPIDNIPKLFCDFPLVGTEDFYLPVVVNSFYFNPLSERDGIWLNDNKKNYDNKDIEDNRALLVQAMTLYQNLLSALEDEDVFDLYNLVEGRMPKKQDKYFSENWFEKNILLPTRHFVKQVKIIESENKESSKKSISEVWFPKRSYDKNIREKLWHFLFDVKNQLVCKKIHLHLWCNKSWGNWNQLTYESILEVIAKQEDIATLSRLLQKSENTTFDWLNRFFTFFFDRKQDALLLNKHACIPNNYGNFCVMDKLYINKVGNKELIEILSLMGEDWKEFLVHEHFSLANYREKSITDISNAIRAKVDNSEDYEIDIKFTKAVRNLTEWLDSNPNAKEIFPSLYPKRASLFMGSFDDKESLYTVAKSGKLTVIANIVNENPELLDDIEKVNQITNLLKELDGNDIEILKELIKQDSNSFPSSKLVLTIERIAGLGIITEEQLKEFLEDKGYENFFSHESISSIEWKQAVLEKIQRAKKRVLEHLKQLEAYNCENVDDVAETVISGVKKNGVSISIVIRPSESELIIIYYESEILALETENAELWVENGIDTPEQITLGRIIRANRMIKIPIDESN